VNLPPLVSVSSTKGENTMAVRAIEVRNQFKGQIREIVRGDVVSEVDVQTSCGIVTSVITTRSVDELQLQAGADVIALVKVMEVAVARPLTHVAPGRCGATPFSRSPNSAAGTQDGRNGSATADLANRMHAMSRSPMPMQHSPATQPAIYRLRDVMRITALSRSTIYRRIAEGRFPAPIHLGGRASGWANLALQEWIKDPEGYRAVVPQPGPGVT
jgi:prophage regulatory protein